MLHKVDRVVLDSISWTPINAGINCDAIELENITGVDLKLRTTDTDPNTESIVPPLIKYPISSPTPKNVIILSREVLIYGQLAAGSADILRRAFSNGRIV